MADPKSGVHPVPNGRHLLSLQTLFRALCYLLTVIVLAWGGHVFLVAHDAKDKATTACQKIDQQEKVLKQTIDRMETRQMRLEDKMDRVLERLPR
jgi:hypothetical protein